MSAENAKKFIEKLGTDKDFAEQFAKCKQAACIEFAAKAGLDCTPEEISSCCASISDDELQKITGGWGWFGDPRKEYDPGELFKRRVTSPASTSSYDPSRHKGTNRY